MKKLPLVLAMLLALCVVVSCDEEWPEEPLCTCGGNIGGWENPKDTSVIEHGDSTGGFCVDISSWDSIETHDIYL